MGFSFLERIMDIEKYEEFIKQGKFYRPSNFICDAMGLLNVSDSELVLIMYIHRWITKPKHHIFDFEVLRDLCWTRNKLLASRKSLVAKGYITAEYENVFCDELGFKSTGYLYDMTGLYEEIYRFSYLSDNAYLEAKKAAYEKVRKERLESGKHLRFQKDAPEPDSEDDMEDHNRDSPVPIMESDSSYYGTDESHERAPSKTIIKHNKDKDNTTEEEEPSAPHEEPKVPSGKKDLARNSVPLADFDLENPANATVRLSQQELDAIEMEADDAQFAEGEAESAEKLQQQENPTDIANAIIQWFAMEMKSPDVYILPFRKARIAEEKLRQFWVLRDKWREYKAIQKTDRSLMMLVRNIDQFIETYWESHLEELRVEQKNREFQEMIWEKQRLMDEYAVWRIIEGNDWDDDTLELANMARTIREKECRDHTLFFQWASNGSCNFDVRDGRLFLGKHEVVKGEFSKEAIIAHVESLKNPSTNEIIPDASFEAELFASLRETEQPRELSKLEMERFDKILTASLEEDE